MHPLRHPAFPTGRREYEYVYTQLSSGHRRFGGSRAARDYLPAVGTLPEVRRAAIALLAIGSVVLVGLIVLASTRGDDGPGAPAIAGSATDCFDDVCAEHPTGWEVEVGDTFLSFRHPLDPEQVLGSVGKVNMEALVTETGGTWPAPPQDAARGFFELLGQDQDAGLDEGPFVLPDGSVEAAGHLEGLRLWYRLIPVDGARGIGIEIRAPNDSWQPHADAWRTGLRVDGDS